VITVNGDQTGGSDTIAVSGRVVHRGIALSGDLAFGGVSVGAPVTRMLRVQNTGNAPMRVAGITAAPGGFASSTWSGTITAGAIQDVPVIARASAPTARIEGTLTVNANHTSGTNTHPFSGWGTAPCRTIALDALSFTTWRAGTALSMLVRHGGAYPPATVAITSTNPPAWLNVEMSAGSEFRLYGTPVNPGTITFTVTISDVIGCTGSREYTLTITGTATPQPPQPFGKVSPAHQATGQPSTLTLSWQASAGATSYEYCVDSSDNSACDATWISVGNSIGAIRNDFLTGTTYFWQARAVNALGTTYADGGAGAFWRFTTSGTAPPPTPTNLVVSSISGTTVTLRWTPPAGAAPTGYVLEGGLSPGQVLASFNTGSAFPIYTLTAPSGSFYVRIRALSGTGASLPSNEVRLHVGVPVAPSPPASFLATVSGTSVSLSWITTFEGGAPSSIVLNATGSATAAFTLPLGESASFAGVPAGTYTLSLRATNAGGTSAPSNPVTITVPTSCTGPPAAPANFLAHRTGRFVQVIWEPAASGAAPTGYVLGVSGAFVGSIPTPQRSMGGAVGPGTYHLSVSAINGCGASPPTAVQTLTVP
jgi:hypothetical protein